MRAIVFADVLKLEAFRQIEIPLHRAELPEATDGVFNLEVDLRAVKGRFAFHALVSDTSLVESFGECAFRLCPILFFAKIMLARVVAFDGQLELRLVEAERAKDLNHKINAIANLFEYLLRRAEEVRVVNCKTAHAHQAVQCARQSSAIHRAHL